MESNTLKTISFEDTSIAFSSKNNLQLRKAYWLFGMINRPWLVGIGTKILKWALNWHLPVKWAIRQTIFAHFCGGETIQDCAKTVETLSSFGIGTILDYSVEGEKTEVGFEKNAEETIRTIKQAAQNPLLYPCCVFKVTGLASFDLLAKKQNTATLSPTEQESWQKAKERLERICQCAYDNGVYLLIDGEETWIQGAIDGLVYEMMRKFNQQTALIINTYQLYCRAALPNLKKDYENAEAEGYYLGAKLVRGAYMEKEANRAIELNYPNPIQPSKQATDEDYNSALRFCVEKRNRILLYAGTHNEESCLLLTNLMNENGISPNDKNFYFAQLYGMSDHISFNLAKAGYNVAKYVPYGPVGAVMPYLFRRAAENTSVAGQSSREYMLIKKELNRRRNSVK
jgi:proline dehydrogenase